MKGPTRGIRPNDETVVVSKSISKETSAVEGTYEVTKTISFISEKGGVGKTTACYHIAVALNRFHDKKVLVVDADYQRGGISGRFFPDIIESFASGEMPGTTLFHKFQQLYSASTATPNVDVREWKRWNSKVDVIPADPRLSSVSKDKLPSTNSIMKNNVLLLRHLQVIWFVLDNLKDEYDYILIDSHPEISDILRSVIYASDYCVSPVKLDRQSAIGVATVIGEIKDVNADVAVVSQNINGIDHNNTEFAGAMGMMAREWGGDLKQTEAAEYRRLRKTGKIFKTYVTEGDGLRQAAAQRTDVFGVTGANADKQSKQFKELTLEFLGVCK